MSHAADVPPPARYLNRELSWLAFNQRVLEEAADPRNPLLERVKFFCIVSSNLDEFFEVRVAGLRQEVESGVVRPSPDGLRPAEALRQVLARARQQVDELYACWREALVPQLAARRIRFLRLDELDDSDLAWLDGYYQEQVHPVLTPLAIDQSHPFPLLNNRMLYVVVKLVDPRGDAPEEKMSVVQVPPNLPRLVRMPRAEGRQDYLFLGRIIGHFLQRVFAGMQLIGHWLLRVTRNGELYSDPENTQNLLRAVELGIHKRSQGRAVRLEISHDCPDDVGGKLLRLLDLTEDDLYRINGPLHPARIMTIAEGVRDPELLDPPFAAPVSPLARDASDLFAAIRTRDILLHHPFESFQTVIDFLQQAATDPGVLAIKQTLYRTGGDPRIVDALREAARNGKQVTAIVELKARFDERNNIQWARQLEQAGVHVVYGLLGYKIHAKVTLVVRAENQRIRRYVHLATGNYNATTARLYTDLGLLSCRADLGEDATQLFNLLTGICQFQPMRRFLTAPFDLHTRMLELIRQEQQNAERGLPARVIAKMNSLVDPGIIDALYDASRAGVAIDLIVRGVCCLRAGVPGLSENIRVRSIVDRFLEHSRIFYFENAAAPRVFLGSADWMPRNFFRRIEVVFPIEDGTLRERIVHEVLEACLSDNTKARLLQPDGTYRCPQPNPGGVPRRSQSELLDAAASQAGQSCDRSPAPAAFGLAPPRPAMPRVTIRRRPD